MTALDAKRSYACETLDRYWSRNSDAILSLPIPQRPPAASEPLPPALDTVRLPEWAADLAPDQGLLVPRHLIGEGNVPAWQRTDWFGVVFWYLNASAERAYEQRHGPVHSYSYRLQGWDTRLWERAWVNRIGMFLRRWAAQQHGADEASLFGPLPPHEITLTHDVDAIRKTLAIRFKQSAFHVFNAVRIALRGKPAAALSRLGKAARFLSSSADYWRFAEIAALERRHGLRSHFNVYGGRGGWRRTPLQILLDPAYNVQCARLADALKTLHRDGWTIGLHQSFSAWRDPELMQTEKKRLEQSLGAAVNSCRQHWLRFGWDATWAAQQQAGLTLDTTLGFNDRPGFRNATALRFHPWDNVRDEPMQLAALPLVLMDSHLYDYAEYSRSDRALEMQHWIDEIKFVRGAATVVWHPHVLDDDYGWRDGFDRLVTLIAAEAPA